MEKEKPVHGVWVEDDAFSIDTAPNKMTFRVGEDLKKGDKVFLFKTKYYDNKKQSFVYLAYPTKKNLTAPKEVSPEEASLASSEEYSELE